MEKRSRWSWAITTKWVGYHELFYNGLLDVLYGVVGLNVTTIANNVQLFKEFYYKTNVTGDPYALDTLMIDPDGADNKNVPCKIW